MDDYERQFSTELRTVTTTPVANPSHRSEYSPLYVSAILFGYDPEYVRRLSIPEIVELNREIGAALRPDDSDDEPEPKSDFWSGTEKTPDGCWLWKGAKRAGYGAVKVGGKVIGAHVRSYQLAKGPVPPGLIVCHRCPGPLDHKDCINPEHLYAGTYAQNRADSKRRYGR